MDIYLIMCTYPLNVMQMLQSIVTPVKIRFNLFPILVMQCY